jgi:hypothetical protein
MAAPDGRFLVLLRGQSWTLVDTTTDRVKWEVPPRLDPSQWIGDRYLWLEGDDRGFAADVVNRLLWTVPGRSLPGAVSGQFCYSAGAANGAQFKGSVVCQTSPDGNTVTLLTAEGHQTQHVPPLLTDPTNRFLAFAYQRSPAMTAGLLRNGVAHATKPLGLAARRADGAPGGSLAGRHRADPGAGQERPAAILAAGRVSAEGRPAGLPSLCARSMALTCSV